MLSERHDASILTFWLREFLRLGASMPNEFIVDMSFALLNAGAIAFGDHSNIEAYVNTLFHELLLQSQNVDQNNHNRLPLCHVRIDIAHLMKNVASSKSLKSVRLKVKEMFVRSVGLMVLETDLDEIRAHIRAVLFAALSLHRGKRMKSFVQKMRLLFHFIFETNCFGNNLLFRCIFIIFIYCF